MQNMHTLFIKYILFLSLASGMVSCQKEDLSKEKKFIPLNSITMQLNGQAWQPSQIGEEACMRTFNGAWSWVGENGEQRPFYTISAFRDPQAIPTYQKSENAFKLQITNVKKTAPFI